MRIRASIEVYVLKVAFFLITLLGTDKAFAECTITTNAERLGEGEVYKFGSITLSPNDCGEGPFSWSDSQGPLGEGSSKTIDLPSRYAYGPGPVFFFLNGTGSAALLINFGRPVSPPTLTMGNCRSDGTYGRIRDFLAQVTEPPGGESDLFASPVGLAVTVNGGSIAAYPVPGSPGSYQGSLYLAKGANSITYTAGKAWDGALVEARASTSASCPDTPPELTLGSDEIRASLDDNELRTTATVTDAELDGFVRIEWELVSAPSNASVQISGQTYWPNSTSKISPTAPGGIKPGRYVIRAKAIDDVGVESNQDEIILTYLPDMDFKVRLASNMKEYLFDDCAPYEDTCKFYKDDFKAGEFLVGDAISLDGTPAGGGAISGVTYAWEVKKLPLGEPQQVVGNLAQYSLPIDQGDYEVSFKIISGSNERIVGRKRLKARASIEADSTFQKFYQINYNQKMGNRKEFSIKAKGCLLTSTANIFNKNSYEVQPNIPLNPVSLDEAYVASKSYLDDRNLSLASAVSVHNIFSPVVKLSYAHKGKQDLAFLEDLGRRRKHAIIEVHGLSVSKNKPAKEIEACIRRDPKDPKKIVHVLSFEKCHEQFQHFVSLNGVKFESGSKKIAIIDPVSPIRSDLDNSVYNNEYRSVRDFSTTSGTSRRDGTISASIFIDDSEISIIDIFSGKNKISAGESDLGRNQLEGAYVEILPVLDSGTASGIEFSKEGGKVLEIPSLAAPGQYTVGLISDYSANSNVQIKLKNSLGEIVYKRNENITFRPGEAKFIAFDVSELDMEEGAVNVFGARVQHGADTLEIHGKLSVGPNSDGSSVSAEGIYFNVSSWGEFIHGENFLSKAGNLIFHKNDASRGIRHFLIDAEGNFEVSIKGVPFSNLLLGDRVPVSAQIGNDSFSGYIQREQFGPASILAISFEKAIYNVGDKANIFVDAESLPVGSGRELYLEASIDGRANLPKVVGAGRWSIVSPKLTSGTHNVSLKLFSQDARLSKNVADAIYSKRLEILEIDSSLDTETDPEKIEVLEKRRIRVFREIEGVEEFLSATRRSLGGLITKDFDAVE